MAESLADFAVVEVIALNTRRFGNIGDGGHARAQVAEVTASLLSNAIHPKFGLTMPRFFNLGPRLNLMPWSDFWVGAIRAKVYVRRDPAYE